MSAVQSLPLPHLLRIYALDAAPLQQVDRWLEHFRGFWVHKLMALDTEIARGRKAREKP